MKQAASKYLMKLAFKTLLSLGMQYVARGLVMYALYNDGYKLTDEQARELAKSGFGHARPIQLRGLLGRKWLKPELYLYEYVVDDIYTQAAKSATSDELVEILNALRRIPTEVSNLDQWAYRIVECTGDHDLHLGCANLPEFLRSTEPLTFDEDRLLKHLNKVSPAFVSTQRDAFWDVVVRALAKATENPDAPAIAQKYSANFEQALQRVAGSGDTITYTGLRTVLDRLLGKAPVTTSYH